MAEAWEKPEFEAGRGDNVFSPWEPGAVWCYQGEDLDWLTRGGYAVVVEGEATLSTTGDVLLAGYDVASRQIRHIRVPGRLCLVLPGVIWAKTGLWKMN